MRCLALNCEVGTGVGEKKKKNPFRLTFCQPVAFCEMLIKANHNLFNASFRTIRSVPIPKKALAGSFEKSARMCLTVSRGKISAIYLA